MCGINGFTWQDEKLIKAMNTEISYRGPDDSGIYSDKHVTLGHNRLSIIDLTSAGHQPMSDSKGDLWIVFNGEIYNFMEVRQRLEKKGYRFRSETDTEVIISAYEEYGAKCLGLLNGMFAFAIWDRRKQELILARDRLGVKPLYYHHVEGRLIFSSEMKAILLHDIPREMDISCLNSFITYRFIPSEKTMISGIKKLQPGHYAVFRKDKFMIHKYWDIEWSLTSRAESFYVKKLDKLLMSSVERRLMSDVPLGAYLSGGIDSSLVVAMNSKLRPDPVKTFTVGFGHESDEFGHARKAAEYLSTDHHELVLDYKQVTKALPRIVWYMDEPNSDITMVPLYFLSEFAKKKVTVVNTGEGADELFSGYQHYRVGAQIFRQVPGIVKRSVYGWYYSPFKKTDRKKLISAQVPEDKTLQTFMQQDKPFLNNILHFDIKHELPNWQLQRVDRMTMAHAMEARVPFLDYNVVNFSAGLPIRYKQPGLDGKYLLKKVAMDYLPKEIVMRKKQGFTTPMHAWMKDNLEGSAESLLMADKKPFLDYAYINSLIEKHKSTTKPRPFQLYSYRLLMLLLFDIWYEEYINKKSIKEIGKMLC